MQLSRTKKPLQNDSLPDSLSATGVQNCGYCAGNVTCNGQIGGKRNLHVRRFDDGNGNWKKRELMGKAVGRLVNHHGRPVHLAEFVVPEGGDGNEEVPWQHSAHPDVEKSEATKKKLTNHRDIYLAK